MDDSKGIEDRKEDKVEDKLEDKVLTNEVIHKQDQTNDDNSDKSREKTSTIEHKTNSLNKEEFINIDKVNILDIWFQHSLEGRRSCSEQIFTLDANLRPIILLINNEIFKRVAFKVYNPDQDYYYNISQFLQKMQNRLDIMKNVDIDNIVIGIRQKDGRMGKVLSHKRLVHTLYQNHHADDDYLYLMLYFETKEREYYWYDYLSLGFTRLIF